MKILQINCVYKIGSTGKIVYDLKKYLDNKGIENAVYYGNGIESEDENTYKFSSIWYSRLQRVKTIIFGMQYGNSFSKTNKIINSIKEYNPDIVHLHCINGYWVNIYRLIDFLKKNKIKTVLTLHAEFMHTGNCSHSYDCEKWKTGCGKCPEPKQTTGSYFFDRTHRAWLNMKKAFDNFGEISIVSVSEWLMNRAMISPIMNNHKHLTIHNGIDTDIFKFYDNINKEHEKYLDKKLIIYVTPNFKNRFKGGDYVLELARKMPEYNFLIVGYNADYVLPSNVFTLNHTNNQIELAQLYSIATCTVLTSKKETFSMIVAESLCCGTPICGFYAGAPETICIKEYSKFVPYGDTDMLKDALEKTIENNHDKKVISNIAKLKYDYKIMCDNYYNLYKKIINN